MNRATWVNEANLNAAKLIPTSRRDVDWVEDEDAGAEKTSFSHLVEELGLQIGGEVPATCLSGAITPTALESRTNEEVVVLEGNDTTGSPQPIENTASNKLRRATAKDFTIDSVEARKRLELPSDWNATEKSDSRDPEVATQLLGFTVLPDDIINRIGDTDHEAIMLVLNVDYKRAQDRLNAVLLKKKELNDAPFVEKQKLDKCINDQALFEVERDHLKKEVE
ncbi:hypothetical protein CRG98_029214 [Punica granatum]|uniref:Uncharacterized protein n=1 Tax=Punica granatum TaxID=22663 RepID=A0A2I0J3T2_PUNGR|nr:hypothetical protein CRG98_029214 [Punica granatum]